MKEQIILISLFYLFIFVYSNSEPTADEQKITNLYYNKEKDQYIIGESKSIDENSIAYAVYNKSYERTGWDFLLFLLMTKKTVNMMIRIKLMLWDI